VPGTTERHPAVSGNQRLSGAGQPQGGNASQSQLDRARHRFALPGTAVGRDLRAYSHSMVLGGLLEMSSATRFTPGISLMMRLEIRSSRS
jgi:hypothetical protein